MHLAMNLVVSQISWAEVVDFKRKYFSVKNYIESMRQEERNLIHHLENELSFPFVKYPLK